ncbi:ceramide synthase 2-like isoform X2 [Paramormyrops kingsleyae]|uniref:Ceramide synthase 4a n=2 Tax=Paramormyrops kingsleyae TaxID=1676925 RepID=A0A3B3SJQ3_9TELE|nr:ceramide synthase 2-like isoform X2 [Paramormyrops kingsleyae]
MEALLDRWLWWHEYWLPPGITWDDMEMEGGTPRPRDLLATLPLALGFVGLRFVFERAVARPLSVQLGVRDRIRVRVSPVSELESFYNQNSHQPSQSSIISLSKKCDLTQRQVETWFRHRRNQDRPSNTKKFCEACWRFAFYLLAFFVGLASLINAPWLWDQRACWHGYPKQSIAEAHYWYYAMELAFYWSLLLCVSVDVKRKDFKEQIIHHVTTIFLIGFSYCANYVRIGTLVLMIHDSTDILLESAKMLNYAGWKKICDVLFVIFAVLFLVTRLVLFPGKIIHATLVLSMEFFKPFFGYYFFNVLLLVLQALHVFWAWLILRMVYKFIFLGKVKRDERSDEESSDEEDERADEEDVSARNERECALKSKLTVLSNCVLNNFSNRRKGSTCTMPKTSFRTMEKPN